MTILYYIYLYYILAFSIQRRCLTWKMVWYILHASV